MTWRKLFTLLLLVSSSSNEDKSQIPTTERYEDSDTTSEKCFIQNICCKSKFFTANIIIASTLVFIHSTKIHWSSIICRFHVLINMPKPQDPSRLTFNMWIKRLKYGKPLLLCLQYRKFVSPPTNMDWKWGGFLDNKEGTDSMCFLVPIYPIFSEKAMAPDSSTLAWKVPWTEEPGRLQSMGSRGVGHDWATSLSLFTFMHWRRKWQPTPLFLPGESQGRGSLMVCHLWGRTESDTTEAT